MLVSDYKVKDESMPGLAEDRVGSLSTSEVLQHPDQHMDQYKAKPKGTKIKNVLVA